ncbi:MAG: hypothetical protein ACREKH_04335, partial [Candidatus Rokuibacteriota bacterium]
MAYLRQYEMAARYGDPGLFSFVKKAVKGVGSFLGSPLGLAATTLIPGGLLVKGAAAAARIGRGAKVVQAAGRLAGLGRGGARAAAGAGVLAAGLGA